MNQNLALIDHFQLRFLGLILSDPGAAECWHDTVYHLMSLMSLIVSGDDDKRAQMYTNEKQRLNKLVNSACQKIMRIKRDNIGSEKDVKYLWTFLGAVTDTISTYQSYEKTWTINQHSFDEMIGGILSDPRWVKYFKKRYGEVPDIDHLRDVWKQG